MKKRILYITVLLSLAVFPAMSAVAETPDTEGIQWMAYQDGLERAKAEGKKIYINFHADWCYYCKVMAKTTFKDKSVISYLNEKFVSIRINSDKEKQLAREFMVRGLPSNWFLESDGKRIGLKAGYLEPKQLLENLQFVYEEKYKNTKQ